MGTIVTTGGGSGGGGGGGIGSDIFVNAVTQFGVDNTGTTADNSTALNTAIQTAGQEGFDLWIPGLASGATAVVLIQNPIQIGNGTTTTASTYPGVRIVGGGHSGASSLITNNGAGTADQLGRVCIQWNGAAAPASMLNINGPIQGCGLKHLTFYGGASTYPVRGILAQACQFGEFDDLSFTGVSCAVHEVGLAATIGGSSNGVGNSMWNRYRHIFAKFMTTPIHGVQLNATGAIQSTVGAGVPMGFVHDGQNSTNNTCFSYLEDVNLVGAGTGYAVVFAGCDSIRYKSLLTIPAGGTNQWSSPIAVYYGSGFPAPKDNTIDSPDFGGAAIGTNLGGSFGAFQGNYMRVFNTNTNNGVTPNPQLAYIKYDHPYGTGLLGPPAVPASTVAFQNLYGCDADVYVAGGTVTDIRLSINGTAFSTGMTSGRIRVPFQASIAITYSVAPTWVWVGN